MLNTIVEGKYRVKSRLGSGAQATVYLVEEVDSGLERAMKVLTLDFHDQPLMVKRFRREFAACSRLDHPSIVKLYHYGCLPDETHYYVMDLLPYDPLDIVLEKEAPLSEERTKKILYQLLDAMVCYHRASVVHRDLKPANIILAPNDRPIIVDFGLVRDLTRTPMTKTGTAMGTPYYISPEVLQGLPADGRSDIYALGVIAYEMLLGELPFQADELATLFNEILVVKPKPPSEICKSLTPLWDHLILKCLEKDPDLRFGSCSELIAQLDKPDESTSGERKKTVKREAVRDDSIATEIPMKRPSIVVPFMLFLLLVFGLCWSVKPNVPKSYSVHNLLTEPRTNALWVSWQSDEPYPSKILELESGKLFSGQDGKAVREHSLLLAPLSGGKNVSFKICFPNGKTSLKKSGSANQASLSSLRASLKGNRTQLSWSYEFGKSAELILDDRVVPCEKTRDRWQVILPKDLTNLSKLHLSFTLHDERRVVVDLVPFIRKRALSAKSPLAKLDDRQFVSNLSVRMGRLLSKQAGDGVSAIELTTQKYRQDVRKLLGRVIPEAVKEMKLYEDYASLVAWSPLLFESELLKLSFNERHTICERLNKLIMLSLYSYTRKSEPRFKLKQLPKFGEFSLSAIEEDEEKGGQILVDNQEAPKRLTPPHFGFDLAKRKVRFSALIYDKHKFASLALHLRLLSFRNFLLQLRINDKVNLYIYDEPYLSYREKEFITVVQQVPLAALKEGENNFALSAVQIYDGAARSHTDLALVRMVSSKKVKQ
jgi:serine/threonine protein kinase